MIAGKPLQAWLDRADALGAEGKFFEAHEELEHAWNRAEGAEKILLQGLIQICAGLHRWNKNGKKTDGVIYLLDRGEQKVARAEALLTPGSRRTQQTSLEQVRASLTAPKAYSFRLAARKS